MRSFLHSTLTGCGIVLFSAASVSAQDAAPPGWEWSGGGLKLEGGLETYSAFYAMRGTWWNRAADSYPDFD